MYSELRLRGVAPTTSWSSYSIVPLHQGLTWNTAHNDMGAFTVSLPQSYVVANSIGDQTVFEVAPNGVSCLDHWFVAEGSSSTYVVDGNVWRTFSGRSMAAWLEDAIVYPSTWPTQAVTTAGVTVVPLQGHSFQNATPGNIIRTLVARGVERGAFAWLDVSSFTGTTTTDSAGWSSQLTTTYSNGTTVLAVLQDLATRNLIQWHMDGMSLKLYNPDSQIVHRSIDSVYFRNGNEILTEQNNTDSTGAKTTALIEGDQSIMQEANSTALTTAFGRRRETYVSQGGITDKPTLLYLANQELAIAGAIKIEETFSVTDSILPWIAYTAGDWVWTDITGVPLNLQVQQISGSVNDSNTVQIALTLGTIIDDEDAILQRKIDAITGSTTTTYGPTNTTPDYLAPSPPSGVAISPTAYRDQNGHDLDLAVVTWVAPTTNIDASAITDLDHFDVAYLLSNTSTWSASTTVPAGSTAAYFSSLPCGYTMTARVRSVDTSGNASTWTVIATPVTLPKYIVTPKTPSTPTAASSFQSIIISWDGKASDGTAYDASWDHTDIFVSSSSGFSPSTSNKVGAFATQGGALTISGLAYSTSYYVKLIAYDKSGNSSAASAQSGAATAAQLSDPDLPAKLVTGAKIADGTINTAQLTVASFGDSVAANGGFEDPATNTSLDNTGSAHWTYPYSSGTAPTITRSTAAGVPAAGLACLQIAQTAGTSSATIANSDNIPTSVGDVWYVSFKAKASRAGVTSVLSALALAYDSTHMLAIFDTNNPWLTLVSTGLLTTTWQTFEGQVVVPTGTLNPLVIARVLFQTSQATDSAAVNIFLDDVKLQPVGGSAAIKDASIVNAKIANVSADKITVGTLTADVTVSSRIKTSDTGARVELNSTGLKTYDALGNTTLSASDADGSVTMTGTLRSGWVVGSQVVAPDPAVDSPGYAYLDGDGLRTDVVGTTNTVLNPGFQYAGTASTYGHLTGASSSGVINNVYSQGALVSDYRGNNDLIPLYGKGCLKYYNNTDTTGVLLIQLGALQPSTTYTVSWHTAVTAIDDATIYSTNLYGNWAKVQVQRQSDASVIATGRDGYIFLPTSAYPGKYVDAKSSGIDTIGFTGWQVRYWKTFTTPSTWPANTAARLQLPCPVTSSNTVSTTQALCVDGIQCEPHPYVTRYCDGDTAQCNWTGEVGNSTSVRSAGHSAWFPPYADPYISGNQSFDLTNIKTIKIGSGPLHGSNYLAMTITTQAIPTGTWTSIVANSPTSGTRYAQDDGLIFNGTNRLIAPVTGMWSIYATITFAGNSTGYRMIRLFNTTAAHITAMPASVLGSSNSGDDISVTFNWTGYSVAGTNYAIQVLQNSGSSLNALSSSVNSPYDATNPIFSSINMTMLS